MPLDRFKSTEQDCNRVVQLPTLVPRRTIPPQLFARAARSIYVIKINRSGHSYPFNLFFLCIFI